MDVKMMKPIIVKASSINMVLTPERCSVAENYSSQDGKVSIAIASVKPGVTTVVHHLAGIEEIYIITQGTGLIDVKGIKPTKVVAGDVIIIPDGASQCIKNLGDIDLVFYCVCTPKFTQEQYFNDENFVQ
jgi:mannose-6-phosphate isomerase-like protein (cupin superfamily)